MKALLQGRQDVVLSITLGAVTSLVIVAFILTTERVGERLYTEHSPPWARIVVPTLGALVAGVLTTKFFPDARGSGIPQTKAALATNQPITFRTVIGKFLCCSISLGSGISLGREGPSVQIGAGLASSFGRWLKLTQQDVNALVPVGTAAALAAAFNTPIAAVLFSLEEVIGDLHARVLGSVVMGAASSWLVLRLLLGDQPLFRVPQYELKHPLELVAYAVMGLLGGLVSAAFQSAMLRSREYFRRFPLRSKMIQPAVGGLAVGLMAFWIPEILGVGYAAVDRVLHGEIVLLTIAILLPLKVIATSLSYSSGNPGGIFGPSLFFGAMIGGFFGTFFHQFLPGYAGSAGAYALVGMGATFAGIIRTPMTSVIMIFELTRDYSSIVPLMICNLASYWIACRLQPTPIYEALAAQEGIQLPKSPERRPEPDLVVRDAMQPVVRLVDPDCVAAQVPTNGTDDVFVGREGVLWGVLRHDELIAKAKESPGMHLSAWISAPGTEDQPLVEHLAHVHPDHKIEVVLHRLAISGQSVLPVLDRVTPRKLLGEVRLDDLLRTCRQAGLQRD